MSAVPAVKPSSPQALTALVADDEQLSRDELCFQLDQIEGIEVVAQAANGVEALEEISRTAPDVAFLDVQMPGLTGFEVARKLLEAGTGPSVIFVTAFDQRAIEAFEVNAVDYVLKPVDTSRLETAVMRASGKRCTIHKVSEPQPQPSSRMRWPSASSARWA